MLRSDKMDLLLLSGSKAAGNLPPDTKPGYLDFAETWIKAFFSDAITNKKPILFVPYARPGGDTEEEYFDYVKARAEKMGITLICAPTEGISEKDLENIGGIYIGGGHTYTLLDKLQKTGSLEIIRDKVIHHGLRYMGSSAGTIITCPTIKTTNDMPGSAADVIDLRSFGFLNVQFNCHYIDDSMHDKKHQGETRDTRIKEFLAFNPDQTVLGLYEGTALSVQQDKIYLLVSPQARNAALVIFDKVGRREVQCSIGENDISYLFEPKKVNQSSATTVTGSNNMFLAEKPSSSNPGITSPTPR